MDYVQGRPLVCRTVGQDIVPPSLVYLKPPYFTPFPFFILSFSTSFRLSSLSLIFSVSFPLPFSVICEDCGDVAVKHCKSHILKSKETSFESVWNQPNKRYFAFEQALERRRRRSLEGKVPSNRRVPLTFD